MGNKHTPGPWAVNPIAAQVDAFDGGAPLPVCQLLWPTDERSEAETEANARLIAEAPNMLTLIEELLDLEGPQPGSAAWAEKARAIVARAREEA